jgi:hypothetical protein
MRYHRNSFLQISYGIAYPRENSYSFVRNDTIGIFFHRNHILQNSYDFSFVPNMTLNGRARTKILPSHSQDMAKHRLEDPHDHEPKQHTLWEQSNATFTTGVNHFHHRLVNCQGNTNLIYYSKLKAKVLLNDTFRWCIIWSKMYNKLSQLFVELPLAQRSKCLYRTTYTDGKFWIKSLYFSLLWPLVLDKVAEKLSKDQHIYVASS